jgi:hypothetical protein
VPFGIPGRVQAKPSEFGELAGSHGPVAVAVANPSMWFETEICGQEPLEALAPGVR